MRLRAAVILLLCFGWYTVSPLLVLASQPVVHHVTEVGTDRDPTSSSWVPRSSDAQELVPMPERNNFRQPAARGRSSRQKQAATLAIASRDYRASLHRSTYPARRRLRCRLHRAGGNEQPA